MTSVCVPMLSYHCCNALLPIFVLSTQMVKHALLSSHSPVTVRSRMAAILLTAGPVSTSRAVNVNWKFLLITSRQFKEAAIELEKLGFGSVVTLGTRGRAQDVFVKKQPSEVELVVESNLDLCSHDVYNARFNCRPSKVIGWNVRAALVAKGLVSKKQFM